MNEPIVQAKRNLLFNGDFSEGTQGWKKAVFRSVYRKTGSPRSESYCCTSLITVLSARSLKFREKPPAMRNTG
ncbi:hypothetical protein RCC30_23045 [Pseudomonas fluorescens]|nr:hypothetical protein RCC30_23045 [Pseudomonas fluorescens]